MSYNLSEGVIKKILSGESIQNPPVLQILGYKQIPGDQNGRYRLMFSDGMYFYPSFVLVSHLTGLISDGDLQKFAVIQAKNYFCTEVLPGKMAIILIDLEIISPGEHVREVIGNPVLLEDTDVSNVVFPTSSTSTNSIPGVAMRHQVPTAAFNKTLTTPNARPAVHPISCVTPYLNGWTIRARVSHKTPIRGYNTSHREGKLFSVDFIDESGEIRATAFDECADRFCDLIEVDKVYCISKARLKPAKRQFNSMKNDYEMILIGDTTVDPCEGFFDSIPTLQFNFISINMLDSIDIDVAVDVIGICRDTSDIETVLSRKSSNEMKKRDVYLVDKMKSEITLTLWGVTAENFDGNLNPVIALKGAKITDFKYRSLCAISSTVLRINPDIREARELREWFDSEGRYAEWQSISPNLEMSSSLITREWKTLAQARDDMKGINSESEYYRTKVTVVIAKRENCMYKSCPTDDCYKKVNDLTNGKYECTKCAQEYESFTWRYLLNISVADFSENQWTTCFNETAELLLQKTAQELQMLKECNDREFEETFSEMYLEPYIFEMRSKMETYNEENRLRTTVLSACPVDPVYYSQKLLSDIKEMEQML